MANPEKFGHLHLVYHFTVPLSMMTLCVEHFHATSHVKTSQMIQLQYSRLFMTTVKEYLKNKILIGPPLENSLPYSDLTFPKKFINSAINKDDEELLIAWSSNYTRAERQRTVGQETTMNKISFLHFYLYKKRYLQRSI